MYLGGVGRAFLESVLDPFFESGSESPGGSANVRASEMALSVRSSAGKRQADCPSDIAVEKDLPPVEEEGTNASVPNKELFKVIFGV